MTTSRVQLAVRSAPLGVVLIGAVVLGGCGRQAAMPSAPAVAPTATAGPTPTATPTVTIAPTATPTAPPLTQSFISKLHGFSVSYPEGWTAEAATKPWTDGGSLLFTDPQADRLYDTTLTDHLFLTIASQPIGDSTPEDWIAETMANYDEGCRPTEPIAVGNASGLIGSEGCDAAVVTTDRRGYLIALRTSDDDPSAVAAYDRAWFEEVLATVQLHPEDAVD